MAKLYKVQLETAHKIYEADGETLEDAVKALNLTFLDIKYKGVLKVQKGEKSFERYFYTIPLRRFFSNRMFRAHILNMMSKFI